MHAMATVAWKFCLSLSKRVLNRRNCLRWAKVCAWGVMGIAIGDALAGHAGALRQVQIHAQAFHSLGLDRGLGQGVCRSAEGPREPLCDDQFNGSTGSLAGRERQKKGVQETALGRSRGGLTTKIHLLADALGLPLGFVLTGGQTHDCTQAIPLLGDLRTEAVIADKGYDTDPILDHLAQQGIEAVIPPRSLRKVQRSVSSLRDEPRAPKPAVEGARQSDDVRVVHGQHTDRKKEGKADRANTRSVRRSAAKLPLL